MDSLKGLGACTKEMCPPLLIVGPKLEPSPRVCELSARLLRFFNSRGVPLC